ncbi:hypothetical protein CEXT_235381 [Caerostris extrusa]|uniref:Uncharacterized protein n=1 Tax=Caerostris extrusa TaxID=172846 RepID=A0AAV4X472_CAEEX|nr:hypothetical protein CEXT_235381 [Caerostris extrusa]
MTHKRISWNGVLWQADSGPDFQGMRLITQSPEIIVRGVEELKLQSSFIDRGGVRRYISMGRYSKIGSQGNEQERSCYSEMRKSLWCSLVVTSVFVLLFLFPSCLFIC